MPVAGVYFRVDVSGKVWVQSDLLIYPAAQGPLSAGRILTHNLKEISDQGLGSIFKAFFGSRLKHDSDRLVLNA